MTRPDIRAQVQAVEAALADQAARAWTAATARHGLTDASHLTTYAEALTRWSERLRMVLDGRLLGDEDWLLEPFPTTNDTDEDN